MPLSRSVWSRHKSRHIHLAIPEPALPSYLPAWTVSGNQWSAPPFLLEVSEDCFCPCRNWRWPLLPPKAGRSMPSILLHYQEDVFPPLRNRPQLQGNVLLLYGQKAGTALYWLSRQTDIVSVCPLQIFHRNSEMYLSAGSKRTWSLHCS